MKPKKGKQSKQKSSVPSNEPDAGAKEQRVRPVRNAPTSTNEIKQSEPTEQKKETVQEPVINFDNLKRETDEIQKITENKNFMRREVTSNWSKYDMTNDDDNLPKAANFSELLQAPISQGGHFQFKHEKNWNVSVTSKYNEYFTPNINNLEVSLQSIPFYKRHCIDPDIFTKDELNKIDNEALNAINRLKVLNFKPIETHDNQKVMNILLENSINNEDFNQIGSNEELKPQSPVPIDVETKKEDQVLQREDEVLQKEENIVTNVYDKPICDKPTVDLSSTATTIEVINQITLADEPVNEIENNLLEVVDQQIDKYSNEDEDLLEINNETTDNKIENIVPINTQSVDKKKTENMIQVNKKSVPKKKEVPVEPKRLNFPSLNKESTSHVKAEELEQWLEDILDD